MRGRPPAVGTTTVRQLELASSVQLEATATSRANGMTGGGFAARLRSLQNKCKGGNHHRDETLL